MWTQIGQMSMLCKEIYCLDSVETLIEMTLGGCLRTLLHFSRSYNSLYLSSVLYTPAMTVTRTSGTSTHFV